MKLSQQDFRPFQQSFSQFTQNCPELKITFKPISLFLSLFYPLIPLLLYENESMEKLDELGMQIALEIELTRVVDRLDFRFM